MEGFNLRANCKRTTCHDTYGQSVLSSQGAWGQTELRCSRQAPLLTEPSWVALGELLSEELWLVEEGEDNRQNRECRTEGCWDPCEWSTQRDAGAGSQESSSPVTAAWRLLSQEQVRV